MLYNRERAEKNFSGYLIVVPSAHGIRLRLVQRAPPRSIETLNFRLIRTKRVDRVFPKSRFCSVYTYTPHTRAIVGPCDRTYNNKSAAVNGNRTFRFRCDRNYRGETGTGTARESGGGDESIKKNKNK